MRRRTFISLTGGAAASSLLLPLRARAQRGERMRRIGVVLSSAANDPEMQRRIAALRQGLEALGWIEGRNFQFESRWPAGDPEKVRSAATELVALEADVVVAGTPIAVKALQQASSRIPVVFVNLADPVGGGLIPSLSSSGTNVTGFTAFEYRTAGKWLELLREIAPTVTRAAFVFGGRELGVTGENFHRALAEAAASMSIELVAIRVAGAATDIEPTIDAFAARPGGGLIAAADAGANLTRSTIIRLAARHRLPAVYPFRYYAVEGGLAAYGVDLPDQYRRAAGYVDRILKGAKPADLPVQAPDKFELIINLRTAKALGIEISPLLLGRADEVIE